MNIIFTSHAKLEMKRRNIKESLVISVIKKAGQKINSKNNRIIFQSKFFDADAQTKMILRVICELIKQEIVKIITVYKTSKIKKYWVED
ncbi:MAG: DUF4258 domain-containing protein [Candidatus Acidulodesulfobacterium ferriphilum]|jgi:hypothetical protein|uniref:DUF4258 domain-containing protein n=1 Tax=Candidatus Acidulodesulfobacterium ferriphilum TaxID=2597223 RepID=A0A519BBW9_9DELT|nr:MAG: DUF4258 domain-containing protein [Candidatus Acidulodesulfobacterium ferriphilum]